MARSIENITTSITEIIPSVEFTNLQVEGSFNDITTLEIFLPERRAFLGWVAREEFVFEAGTDD